jgi:hypothetical protein
MKVIEGLGKSQAVVQSKGSNRAIECFESWSLVKNCTLRVRQQWPSTWCLPFERHFHDSVLIYCAGRQGRLLDVGASDYADTKEFIHTRLTGLQYHSFDPDRQTRQDFYSWDQVEGVFSVIICSQVLEHLSLREGLQTCEQILTHCDQGGMVFFTVPNIFHPSRFLTDPGHMTPWAYDKLGGVLVALGFDLLAIGRYGDSRLQAGTLRSRSLRWLADKLRPYLGVDYASSVCVVGRKP